MDINLDVFLEREADLASRTDTATRVPQIFLNEKLLGGLVVLNSLRIVRVLLHRCLYRASLSGSSSSRTASPAPTWSTASSTTWNAAGRRVNAPDVVDVPDLVEKEMDYRVNGRTFTMLGGIHHFPPNPKKI